MMNNNQFLMTKLAEEAVEVSQRALKAQQFGPDEIQPGQDLTNLQRLHGELNDLLGVVELLNRECGFEFIRDFGAIRQKIGKLNRFREYSRSLGLVDCSPLCEHEVTHIDALLTHFAG